MYSKLIFAITLGSTALMGPFVWNFVVYRLPKPYTSDIYNDIKTSTNATAQLTLHSKEFANPRVIKVTEGVYVAIGYALANSILIEAPEGAIIVDVTESLEAGQQVFAAFRNITKSPIQALIYTHNHADHIMGAGAFVNDPENPPDIWAHHSLPDYMRSTITRTGDITYIRAMRQFGALLPTFINAGIGPFLKFNHADFTASYVPPNRFLYGKEKEVSIAGLLVKIIHVPGETSDQIAVWIPSYQTLLCADDFYRAFPNLYAIRGSAPRELPDWVQSLDIMRSLQPEYLVPSHTKPIVGRQEIHSVLTTYRDAIQYVHDQTIRYMNKGKHPDEIVELVKLPAHMESNPYLLPLYGTVPWSVRGVFSSYLGWFSGDPLDLNPMSIKERSLRFVHLIGKEQLLLAAQAALNETDYQWALELATYLKQASGDDTNILQRARDIKVAAMKHLANQQTSSNGRNYYLTAALEEAGVLQIKSNKKIRSTMTKTVPLRYIFETLPRLFNPENCASTEKIAIFLFSDTPKKFIIHIRNSIAHVYEGEAGNQDFTVKTDTLTMKSIITQETSPLMAQMSGTFSVEGGLLGFKAFMDCFEKD